MLIYTRHRAIHRFFCSLVLVLVLPGFLQMGTWISPAAWAAAAADAPSPQLTPLQLALLDQLVPTAPAEQAPEFSPPLTLLPDEAMALFRGGPITDAAKSPAAKLPDGRILLARLSEEQASASGSGIAATMNAAQAARDKGQTRDAALGFLDALNRCPDSFEAHAALRGFVEIAAGQIGAEAATLVSDVARIVAAGSAPARKAACLALHAQLKSGADVAVQLADTAMAGVAAFPNAPEAYDLPELVQASALPDTKERLESIAKTQPGTLAAWRCAALLTGAEPAWGELASAEARYGLIKACSDRAKGYIQCDNRDAFRHSVVDLGHRSLWDFADDAAQARIVPLMHDALRELPYEERGAFDAQLMRETGGAAPSMGAWMARNVLREEAMLRDRSWGDGAWQNANAMDMVVHGNVGMAMNGKDVNPADKARTAYYRGLSMYNMGWEMEAIVEYENALSYPCSDVIREYAQYGKAYALESMSSYAGGGDINTTIEAYQKLLAEHPRGELAGDALRQLARIYYRAEDYDTGNLFAEQIVRDFPDSPNARYAQSMLNEVRGGGLTTLAKNSAAGQAPGQQVCGPVALRKLLAARGVEAGVDELAQLAGTDASGTSMAGLIKAADAKGVKLAGVQVTRGSEMDPPFIAYVHGNHFVFVGDKGDKGYLVEDVDGSTNWQDDAVLRFGWDGKALVASDRQQVAELLDYARLEQSRGGDNTPNGNNPECANGRCPCTNGCKCPSDPPNPNGPAGPPPPHGSPGSGNPKGTMLGAAGNVSGVNPEFMLYQGTFVANETDFNVPVLGGMKLQFTRNFTAPFGWKRGGTTKWSGVGDLAYLNNIGEGWNHESNLYLKVSQQYGFVLFHDPQGNFATYTRHCEQQGGTCTAVGEFLDPPYNTIPNPNWCICSGDRTFAANANEDYYVRNLPPNHEAHGNGFKGMLDEQGVVLTRLVNAQAGQLGWKMRMPDGTEYGFAKETAWDEHYARLMYIQNRSGAQITFTYDTYGRLTRMDAPSGDGRYLQFAYVGTSNRIDDIILMSGSTMVKSVAYTYDSDENLVQVDRDSDGEYSNDPGYSYYSDPNYPGSFMLSGCTNGDGQWADIDYVWGTFGPWGDQPLTVTATKAGVQKTVFVRRYSDTTTTITNYDTNDVAISKVMYMQDWYGFASDWIRSYVTPTGGAYQQWSYSYNTDHFLTAVYYPTNTSGGIALYASYTHTAQGKVASVTGTGPNGNNMVTSWTYDSATGLLPTTMTDPAGLVTQYFYDTQGRLIQMKHPSLGTNGYQYTYTTAGQIYTVTDPLGKVTTYGYDASGNVTSVTNPLNQTATMTYDSEGRVSQRTDALGKSTSYTYIGQGCGCGGLGQIATITDALNNVTSFQYNAAGKVTKVTDPAGMETDYAYDGMERLTSITAPSGSSNTTTFAYDTLGRMTSTIDLGGHTTTMTYDHMGRLASRTDPVGTVSYAYDTMGNKTSVTDERNKVTSYYYLGAGWLNYTADPLYKYVKNYYDSAGRVTKTGAGSTAGTDPIEYTYSATTGLLTKTRYWTGASYYDADYTYDNAARQTKIADWVNSSFGIQFAYDDAGRLLTKKDYADAKTLSYTYDAAGHIASMTDPNGQTTTYTYTDTGRLDTITAPGSKVWNFDYNNLGQKTQYTHPNGTRTEYGYDTRHRLTSIVHKDASNNTVLDSFTFTLNNEGNITRVTNADGSYFSYGYDARHRVTYGTMADAQGVAQRLFMYYYDVANNITSKSLTVASPPSSTSTVFAYNDANEQTSMTVGGGTPDTRTYDGWGRLATRTQGTNSATYGYRYGGRLYSFASNFGGETAETLQYRGDGRLYSRTTAASMKVYRYDRGWNTIDEEDGSGNLTGTNVYAPGAEVGERLAYAFGAISGGALAYAYHDQLGSTRVWRWWNKGLTGRDDFGPYGEKIASYDLVPRDYALHVNDPNALLFHAAYRDYAAGWGRWITRDPLGMVDGPNVYAYSKDDPVGLGDPFGRSALPMDRTPQPNGTRRQPPPPPGSGGASCDDCGNAPPASASSGVCSKYGDSDTFRNYDAKCVCENAGETPWDQAVRGCLACMKDKGITGEEAHKPCYAAADAKYGTIAGLIQVIDIGIRLSRCYAGSGT